MWRGAFFIRISGLARTLPMSLVACGTAAATAASFKVAHAEASGSAKPAQWYMKPWTSYQQEPLLPELVPGYDRVHVMRRTFYSVSLMGKLRDKETQKGEFLNAAQKVSQMLLNEALGMLPYKPRTVMTPVDGASYITFDMPDPKSEVCVVGIMRAATSMAEVCTREFPDMPVGTMLIQRDEATAEPKLFFSKLPQNIGSMRVLLVDPMLATGGSAKEAIRVLRSAGVDEQAIVLVSIVAAPEGIDGVIKDHPLVRILVGEVDRGLNKSKYIVPGLGDFGDRLYGTTR